MAGWVNKFFDFIGIESIDDDEEERDDPYAQDSRGLSGGPRGRSGRSYREDRDTEEEEEYFPEEREQPARRQPAEMPERRNSARQNPGQLPRRERREPAQTSAGAHLPISGGMKMIVYHPVSYEDTQIIIDNLKNRKPVIVNMEDIELETAQRILDFLSGAVYAIDGIMRKISRGIFVVAPNNYDVVANDEYGDAI